jgi:hypothetical protein
MNILREFIEHYTRVPNAEGLVLICDNNMRDDLHSVSDVFNS